MAIADTAVRAVAEKHRVDILLIKEALVLVGPERGLEFELGGKKFKVPPMLKANPPPDKGSWRRSGAAPATTKAPYKHRAAKHEAAGAKPALPSPVSANSEGYIESPWGGGPCPWAGTNTACLFWQSTVQACAGL